jgi:hypothetical protein
MNLEVDYGKNVKMMETSPFRADVERDVIHRQERAVGLREMPHFDGVIHQPSPRRSAKCQTI